MVVLNKGKTTEFTLRLDLEFEVHGREYFDAYDDTDELLEAARRLLKNASQEVASDGIERVISIAIAPRMNYGDDSAYGVGLATQS